MKIEIGKPKKTKRVRNKFKLCVRSMLGDADGYKTKHKYFDEFDGELEELYKVFDAAITTANRGLGGRDVEKLEASMVKAVLENAVLRPRAVETEKYAEDHAHDYLWELSEIGESDVGYWAPCEMTVSWMDENGDECEVKVGELSPPRKIAP